MTAFLVTSLCSVFYSSFLIGVWLLIYPVALVDSGQSLGGSLALTQRLRDFVIIILPALLEPPFWASVPGAVLSGLIPCFETKFSKLEPNEVSLSSHTNRILPWYWFFMILTPLLKHLKASDFFGCVKTIL